MKRTLLLAPVLAVTILSGPAVVALGQTSGFEVASIKSGTGTERPSIAVSPGGRFVATNQTVKYLIQFAYNVQDYQVSGGPKWIDSNRYDIIARPENALNPNGGNVNQFRLMLQKLLAERFQLVVRQTARELPTYTLIVARGGHKMKERERPITPSDMRLSGGSGSMTGQQIVMEVVAQNLAGRLGRPVRNETHLEGHYDFKLEWSPEEIQPASPESAPAAGPSIFTALQEQLGLKLEARTAPVEVLIVEHVLPPSGN